MSSVGSKIGKFFAYLLITFGVIIFILSFLPIFRAEVSYDIHSLTSAGVPPKATPTPVDQNFSIQIPKININSKVIKNVDPFDSKKYQIALTQGVAHALGSATPNQLGNVFIFAHSAQDWYQANQYNAIFYLLNKLEKNDDIILYYQNKPYHYSVYKTAYVNSNDVSYLKGNSTSGTLQLMTCWPPGTTFKRLIVTAMLTPSL